MDSGYPYKSLSQQHRMRPEIPHLVRQLTYPNLVDAPKTQGPPNLRGLANNLIFVNHDNPEDKGIAGSDTSKRNSFEAEMVFRTAKYLLQQNYEPSNVVILTPYLGQVRRLQEVLRTQFDVVLNELDVEDLARFRKGGRASSTKSTPDDATSPLSRPYILISTIGELLLLLAMVRTDLSSDNY